MNKEIAKKLSKIRKEVGTLQKSSTNPYFDSKYIEINTLIEVLDPILAKHNVDIFTPLTTVDGRPAIKTLFIDLEDGGQYSESVAMPDLSDPQKAGGAITYFRRYALISLLNLRQEDDDANASSKAGSGKKKNTKKTASKQAQTNLSW